MAKTLTEMIAVMQAAERGETVQWRPSISVGDWTDVVIPAWDWTTRQYRVKPKPREWWANIYPGGLVSCHESRAKADVVDVNRRRIECVPVREVLDIAE